MTIKGDVFTYKCPGLPEAYMLLMIVCVGALGGSLHGMRSLADYVGARQLKRSWICYYLLLPVNSAMIALVFYLIIRAGFYSPSATADTAAIMLGLAVLVGLFSEAAMEKLKKIAVALLAEPPQRPDKIEEVPSPDLQGLSPPKGSTQGGDSFKLEGRRFSDDAEVTFNGLKAAVFSRIGDTSITVTTPEHAAGPVDVEVVNPGDKKSKLSGGFTYEETGDQPPVEDPEQPAATTSPTITGVNPNSGPTSGNTPVTIDGTGFDAKEVQFGGLDANVVGATAASISVTTPVHDDPGSVDIVVTNNDGKVVKLESGFTYEKPPEQ